jgi:hypothetical protein
VSYRVEELIAVRGRVKIWRSIKGGQNIGTRDYAVSAAVSIVRTGLGKIRIRKNRTTPKPKGGNTK